MKLGDDSMAMPYACAIVDAERQLSRYAAAVMEAAERGNWSYVDGHRRETLKAMQLLARLERHTPPHIRQGEAMDERLNALRGE